jgi:hypothetical protein
VGSPLSDTRLQGPFQVVKAGEHKVFGLTHVPPTDANVTPLPLPSPPLEPSSTSGSTPNTAVIAAGIGGAVAAVAALVFGAWLIVRWRRRRQPAAEPAAEVSLGGLKGGSGAALIPPTTTVMSDGVPPALKYGGPAANTSWGMSSWTGPSTTAGATTQPPPRTPSPDVTACLQVCGSWLSQQRGGGGGGGLLAHRPLWGGDCVAG